MLKATEHETFVSPTFSGFYAAALSAGYTPTDIAPYHYYRFNKSPQKQAEHFVNTVMGAIGTPRCAFVVDVEDTVNSAVGKQGELKLFLDIVEYLTGFKPIIYTASWWWTTARWGSGVPWAKEYALVEAEYRYDPEVIPGAPPAYVDFDFAYEQTKLIKPTIPSDWAQHAFWQFTSKAKGSEFGATSTYIDVQSFNGTLSELEAVYTKPGTVLIDPRVGTIDLLGYLRGSDGVQLDTDAVTYTQTYNTQWAGDAWRLIKGGSGQYEYLYADAAYIYRREDTSQGNDRFYIHQTNGIQGAPWVKRFMRVGEVFQSVKQVQHMWNNCTPRLPLAQVTDSIKLVAVHGVYTFPTTGKTLSNVIELQWLEGGETYFFALNLGLVGFKDGIADAQFAGQLFGREPLVFVTPTCINDTKYYV